MTNTFVFCVCGDEHVRVLNTALRFLKTFSNQDILVVTTRTSLRPNHDQCLDVDIPRCFDDHQASILLKTSLAQLVAPESGTFCYLDSDVLAVSEQIDDVFSHKAGPVTFAADHNPMSAFSRYAVNCSCTNGNCDHLKGGLWRLFGVRITDPNWQHWNGGVFLFDQDSAEFMRTWHDFTLVAFEDPAWKTRDQGTLIAAAWTQGLQNTPVLPREFNYIVDPLAGQSAEARACARPESCTVNSAYSLVGEAGKLRPAALHMINGGSDKPGWKNFDDATRFLASTELWRDAKRINSANANHLDCGIIAETSQSAVPADSEPISNSTACADSLTTIRSKRVGRLSKDNRTVHGMWVGKRLGKLEMLTLNSFVACGHDFRLWCYDELRTQVPSGVTIMDANQILPAKTIYRRREMDRESGVGKGSLGPFSDLFRYKLLYELGGYWADMDVTCLQPLDFKDKYVFRPHRVGVVGNIMKCPARSRVMLDSYERTQACVNAESPWLMTNRILSEQVARLGLAKYVRPEICNPDWWPIVNQLVKVDFFVPSNLRVIHWLNENWRTAVSDRAGVSLGSVPDRDNPAPGSTLARLYEAHGLA